MYSISQTLLEKAKLVDSSLRDKLLESSFLYLCQAQQAQLEDKMGGGCSPRYTEILNLYFTLLQSTQVPLMRLMPDQSSPVPFSMQQEREEGVWDNLDMDSLVSA